MRRRTIRKLNYAGRCWWCGAPASSAEHKYKKSDLVRDFGRGPYTGQSTLNWNDLTSGAQRPVQGPNSGRVKFGKSMCARCNNERSRPFDLAYAQFSDFIGANQPELLRRPIIALADVYGPEWPSRRDLLLRYYTKHVCCRLADEGFEVPADAIAFLNGGPPPTCMAFDFTVFGEWVVITEAMVERDGHFGFVGMSELWTSQSARTRVVEALEGSLFYRWLHFHWLYDPSLRGFEDPFASGTLAPAIKYAGSGPEEADQLGVVIRAFSELETETGCDADQITNDPALRARLEQLVLSRTGRGLPNP
jgi:hypothetical protein